MTETAIDNAVRVNFNPMDVPENFVNVDWIKGNRKVDHRYQFNEIDLAELAQIKDPKKRWAREREIRERVSALIVQTGSDPLRFIYSSRALVDDSLKKFQEQGTKILKLLVHLLI